MFCGAKRQHCLVLIDYHIYHKSQLTGTGNRRHRKWFESQYRKTRRAASHSVCSQRKYKS